MCVDMEISEAVAILTFDRSRQGNTIDMAFAQELLTVAQAIELDAGVRVVLMTGAGAHFCLGGDLQAMAAAGESTSSYLTELTRNLHAAMVLFSRIDAPVIAAVNGTAAGAGLGLVLAADLAIASKRAKFVASYSGVGLTPDAGCSFYLPRAVGAKRAMELFMTNRVLDADEALAWGLVNQLQDEGDLAHAARELAGRLATGPKGAFGALKRLMAGSQDSFEAQLGHESRLIAERGATLEGREGIMAFVEKRSPRFV